MTVDAAIDKVTADVHNRAFFHKLAQRGYQPQTEQEANDLLQLSEKLAAAQDAVASQPQQHGQSKFAHAVAALDNILGYGETAEDARIKEAAVELTNDPEIFNAVQTLCDQYDASAGA